MGIDSFEGPVPSGQREQRPSISMAAKPVRMIGSCDSLLIFAGAFRNLIDLERATRLAKSLRPRNCSFDAGSDGVYPRWAQCSYWDGQPKTASAAASIPQPICRMN